MNLFDKLQLGQTYADFLTRYASADQKERWRGVHDRVELTQAQRELLSAFRRPMHVLCLAGAWCGDCANQCPIFERFAVQQPSIQVRYLDRDEHADVQRVLQVNGGNRVPVLVFFSEDGCEVSRYGERTLAKYRELVRDQFSDLRKAVGPAPAEPLLAQVTADWLDEFERVQWLLRLSPRLRQKHGD